MSLFVWEVDLLNGSKKQIQATEMQASNGALIFFNGQLPFLGINAGLWTNFSLLGAVQKEDKEKESYINKILNFYKKNESYVNLDHLAGLLDCNEKYLEEILLELFKSGKLPYQWLIDVPLQKKLDNIMPILLRRHGVDFDVLLRMLQQKDETQSADEIQMLVWKKRNPNYKQL